MSRWSRRDNDWDDEGDYDESDADVEDALDDQDPAEVDEAAPRVDPWWVREGGDDGADLGDPARAFDADRIDPENPPEFHEFEFVEPTAKRQRRVLAGVLAVTTLVGVGAIGVLSKRKAIERDLRTHVEANYQQAGLGGLKVTANGRDLTATGVVASEDELKRAQELARAVRGVRRITLKATVETTIAPTLPTVATTAPAPTTTVVAIELPDLSLIVEGKKLTVIGAAPTAEARDAFLANVVDAASFGTKNVKANDLVTVDGSKGALETWRLLGALTAGVPQAKITNLAITIADDVMTLAGVVDDPVIHDRLINAANQVAGDPSHVIDQTSGANRTPTTIAETVTTEPVLATATTEPTLAVVSSTEPATTAAPATVTTTAAPVTTAAAVPVTTGAVIVPATRPAVTAARPVATTPPVRAPALTTARTTARTRAAARRAAATAQANARVAARKAARAAAATKAATKAATRIRTRAAVKASKPATAITAAKAASDNFVASGGADVPDTVLVEEPPEAVPDAEADAPSVSTRDQVRAAIAGASVNFSEGSAEMSDGGRAVVARIARVLANSSVRVEVRAYTDDRGDEQVNRALTQRRANVVRSELIANGVDSSRVSASGLGASNPVASDDTADGRRRNRRVVFALFGS